MGNWTIDENSQKTENGELERLKVFSTPTPTTMLSHYTSREVFWKIMESETLLARHVKFSNDIQENEIGMKKICDAMEKQGKKAVNNDTLPFMICFCGQRDLLSQWRGYAKEGIEIVFDFSKGLYGQKEGFSAYHCFSIMNNDDNKDKGEGYQSEISVLKNGVKEEELYFMGAILAPYHVFYTDNTDFADQMIEDKVKLLCKDSQEMLQQRINRLIPYIKNDKFVEEDEYRLIFDLNTLMQGTQHQMLGQKYVNLEVDGVRKPNIRVKFGNQLDSQKAVTQIYYCDNDLEEMLKELQRDLNIEGVHVELVNNKIKFPMEKKEMLISYGKFQEEIYIMIRQRLQQQSPAIENVKIWCDGHLPIRQIIVGPSRDAEYMANSIREYIKTKYWMNDIEVKLSGIPLRV